jgi:RNA polymerase sigma-70 factor (ECF subfamily)
VVQLYEALFALTGSPVVALNRAVAVGELRGAQAALEQMRPMSADRQLADYQPYWAAHPELLARSGASDEAKQAYDIAIGLERDAAARRFLRRRKSALD